MIINPLVLWMWIGGIIGLIGALIAVWPSRSRRKGAMVRTEADELKEAKYSEIRDAELDHASGKLSDEDYAILDAELRKEAVEILDTVGVGAGTAAPRPGRAGLPSDWEGDEERDTATANGNGNGTIANGERERPSRRMAMAMAISQRCTPTGPTVDAERRTATATATRSTRTATRPTGTATARPASRLSATSSANPLHFAPCLPFSASSRSSSRSS